MPDLFYGTSSFKRDRGNLPELPVINMIAEKAPTEEGAVLQSRPGLKNSTIQMGSFPVRGLFQMDGILNDQLFGVAGTALFANSTNLGSIDGQGPISFGGYEDLLFVNAGKAIWQYDGSSLSSIAFPDDADVLRICVGASRLIAIRKSTGTFYWSDVLTSTIDPLSFATAENSPDRLRDMLFLGDVLILFGAETVEFWPVSDDPNLPFNPLIGRVFPVGIRDTGCAVKLGSSFAWVTEDNNVCVGDPNTIVSTPGLQTLLADSDTLEVWTFRLDGIEYLALRMEDSTWTMNSLTREWSQMESYNEDNWLPRCYEAGYFGTVKNGRLVQWSNNYSDFGNILERRFRAWMPIGDSSLIVFSMTLKTNPGQTTFLNPPYENPQVEMRTSKDGGFTWAPFRSRRLGTSGDYRTKPKWNSLGMYGYPGMMAEFRITDPVPFRVSGLKINEPFGGV